MVESKPVVTSVIQNNRRKLHYLYPDKTEQAEEYDVQTGELVLRKWKYPREIGAPEWIYEIGEAPKVFNPDSDLISASNLNVSKHLTFTACLYAKRRRNKIRLAYP